MAEGRAGASLRTRVMAAAALLVALTCLVTVVLGTTLLRSYLLSRSDAQLRDFAKVASSDRYSADLTGPAALACPCGPFADALAVTWRCITSRPGFALTTATGQKVTIKEASSTTYEKGTSAATVGAVTTGEPVLVLGTTDSTTITATQVIVAPPSTGASNPGGQVIGYSQGEQGSSEQVGQIPADYKQGSGTLVSGTAADKATEAALAAYPGGVVDRVVALGNGDYEVHYIGVNWPHHIFVNQDFQVIGADD